jgi:hypothetical protein
MPTLEVSSQKPAPTPKSPEQQFFFKPSQGVWVGTGPGHEQELARQGFVPVSQERYATERFQVVQTPGGGVSVGGGRIIVPSEAQAITGAIEQVKTTEPTATEFQFKYQPGLTQPTLSWKVPLGLSSTTTTPTTTTTTGGLSTDELNAWKQGVANLGTSSTTTTTTTTGQPSIITAGFGIPDFTKIFKIPSKDTGIPGSFMTGGGGTSTSTVSGYVPKKGELFPYEGKKLSVYDIPKFDTTTPEGQKQFMQFYWAHPELVADVKKETVGETKYTYVSPTEIDVQNIIGGKVIDTKTLIAEPGKIFDVSQIPIPNLTPGAFWTTPITQQTFRFKTMVETSEYEKSQQPLAKLHTFTFSELGGIRPGTELIFGMVEEPFKHGSFQTAIQDIQSREYQSMFQISTAPKEWVKGQTLTGGLLIGAMTLPEVFVPAKLAFGGLGIYLGTQQLATSLPAMAKGDITPITLTQAAFGVLGVGGGSLMLQSGWSQMTKPTTPSLEQFYAKGQPQYWKETEGITTRTEPGEIAYTKPGVTIPTAADIEAQGGYKSWSKLIGDKLGTYQDVISATVQTKEGGMIVSGEYKGEGIFSTGPTKFVTDIGGGTAQVTTYVPRNILGLKWFSVTEYAPVKLETGVMITPPISKDVLTEWAGQQITIPKGGQAYVGATSPVGEAPQTIYEPRNVLGMKWYKVTEFYPSKTFETGWEFKLPEKIPEVQTKDFVKWTQENPMKPFKVVPETKPVDLTKGGNLRLEGGMKTDMSTTSLGLQSLTQQMGDVLSAQQVTSEQQLNPFYGLGQTYKTETQQQLRQVSQQRQLFGQTQLPTTQQQFKIETQELQFKELSQQMQMNVPELVTQQETRQVTEQVPLTLTQVPSFTNLTLPTNLFPVVMGGGGGGGEASSLFRPSRFRLGRTKRPKMRAYPDIMSTAVAQALYGKSTVPKRYSRAEVSRFEREFFTYVPPKELGGGMSQPKRKRR